MEWTDNDFAAFKDGTCIAIATVMEGKGAKEFNREFYTENAGCEIKIMPRAEACEALKAGMRWMKVDEPVQLGLGMEG